MIRFLFVFQVLLVVANKNYIQAQNIDFIAKNKYKVHFNAAYGSYDRNNFDIILPENNSKHGLVVFIHEGGFESGDKEMLYERKEDVKYFLENNIAVATINYRYLSHNDSLGIKLPLSDIQRAIQYLRHHADKYHIDKNRVGCYGVSAGAGASLYFAFHDDLAIKGDTTLAGESTRLKCAGALETQSTYNVFKWKKIVPLMRLVFFLKNKELKNAAANFYGFPDYESFKDQRKRVAESLDMLSMIDMKDPPVYLMNLMKDILPKNDDIIQHHRSHAIALSKRLDKFGVINYLYTNKNVDAETDVDFKVREFMVKYIND